MENIKAIYKCIEANKDDMIKTLTELLNINSEASEPKIDAPFGKGVSDAFLYTLNKGEQDGFITKNVDNFGGHIDFPAEGDFDGETMGILCHLDVVPAGDGWETDPYSATVKDGVIYARGAEDDKGPTIAAYFAMKAIKDANIKLNKNVRLILGLDEETDWRGMDYYLERENPPNFGFTPDADFPLVYAEKGILTFDLAQKFAKTQNTGLELKSFAGGKAPNMVADSARMVVFSKQGLQGVYDKIKQQVASYRQETGQKVNCKGVGKSFEITAEGKPSHGAQPQNGINAISILADFAKNLEFDNEGINDFISFYNDCIGFELDGAKLGIGFEDEISGGTVVNVGILKLDKKSAELTVNVRFPVSYDDETIYKSLSDALLSYNIGIVKRKYQPPLFVEKESRFAQMLMRAYQDVTGDINSKPLIIGGGTYARAMKKFVAFGAKFPNEEEKAHQKNECFSIENLVKCTQIYARAIYMLCTQKNA